MSTLEKNIKTASDVCKGKVPTLGEYERIYTFTTENISDYLQYFDLKNKSLMTVGSSGDQVINVFYEGSRDITLCDINPYAKYYTYLKIASIISLSYIEFKKFFFVHGEKHYYNKHMFSKYAFDNLIKPTLRLLDYESYLFFDELFSKYDSNKIRNRLFNDDELRPKANVGFNKYLHTEENYNKLQQTIRGITFKYINRDLFKESLPGTYDNIFISNISNASTFDNYLSLLKKLDEHNLKENGSMQIAYLWDIDMDETEYYSDWFEIYKLPIAKQKLGKFLTESHQVTSARDILWERDTKRDLTMIYRK